MRREDPRDRVAGPRVPGTKGLLADEQEPVVVEPLVVEPVIVQETHVAALAEHRHAAAAAVVERGGTEGDDPELPLEVGVCRSEEHTSELQSHVNLVCRLLLVKKKNFINFPTHTRWTLAKYHHTQPPQSY